MPFDFRNLNKNQTVLLTHGDSIEILGNGLQIGAMSSNNIVAAIYNEKLKIYGVQFHPEVSLFFCFLPKIV